MRWYAAIALIVVAAFPNLALADDVEDFQRALNAYESQNYPLAVERFGALVGDSPPRLSIRALVLESRKYLAASYLFVGRARDADAQFEALLRDEPDYDLDPVVFPTEVLDAFTSARQRLRSERLRIEEERRRAEESARRVEAERLLAERARLDLLERLARERVVVRENSRWIASLPFGAGQFQNGHDGLGWAFAIGESALLATTIASYLIHDSLRDERPQEDERADFRFAERASRLTNQVSFVALLTAVFAGIVDAHARFVPRVERIEQRDLPESSPATARPVASPRAW